MKLRHLLKSKAVRRLWLGVWALGMLGVLCGVKASEATDASAFAQQVAVAVYHFDAPQAADWPQPVAGYFTPEAFRSFSKAMAVAEVPQQVQARHLHVHAVLGGVAEVRAEGDHLWQVVLPMTVHYQNADAHYQQDLLLNIRVAQVIASGAPRTYKVVQFSARASRCVALDRHWLD